MADPLVMNVLQDSSSLTKVDDSQLSVESEYTKYPFTSNLFYNVCNSDSVKFKNFWLDSAATGDVEVFRNVASELSCARLFTAQRLEGIEQNDAHPEDRIVSVVNNALRSGGDINQSAMYHAAMNGQSEVLGYLFQLPWTNLDIQGADGNSILHHVMLNLTGNNRRIVTKVQYHQQKHPWQYCRRIYRKMLVTADGNQAMLDKIDMSRFDAELGYVVVGTQAEFPDLRVEGAGTRLNGKTRYTQDVADDTVICSGKGEQFVITSQPPSLTRPMLETRQDKSGAATAITVVAPRTLFTDSLDVATRLVEYGARLLDLNAQGKTVFDLVPTNSLYRHGRWCQRWGLVRLRVRLYRIRKCQEEQLLRCLGFTMSRIDPSDRATNSNWGEYHGKTYVCPLEGRSGHGDVLRLPNMRLAQTQIGAVGVRDISQDSIFVDIMDFLSARIANEQVISVTGGKKPAPSSPGGSNIGGMGEFRRQVEMQKIKRRKALALNNPITVSYSPTYLDGTDTGSVGFSLRSLSPVETSEPAAPAILTPTSLADKVTALVPGTKEYEAFLLGGNSGKKTPKNKKKTKKDSTPQGSLPAVPEYEFPVEPEPSTTLVLPTKINLGKTPATEVDIKAPQATPATNLDEDGEDKEYAHIENEFDDDIIMQTDANGQKALQMVSVISHIIASYIAQSDYTSKSTIPDTVKKMTPF